MVVLSNNDGCAVARSNEVKALGVKMGPPWFQMQDLSRQHGILAFSSNYTLYGDMSNRVTRILRDFCPELEVYSIDESFLRIETVAQLYGGAIAMGQRMRARIRQWTGLPVCVGSRGEQLGLSEDKVKFYDALANNESAAIELNDETLKKIAHELTENLRQNITVDCAQRESVRAKLRLMVKRILRKYKYPPDQQETAVELVLQQAEVIGESWG